METLKFKSSIKCSGCVATVTPHLNSAEGVENWQVDLNHPDKILTVTGEKVSEEQVKAALKNAGYTAEKIR